MSIRLLSLLTLAVVVGMAAMTITTSATSAQPASQTLIAILRGSEEAPGPGDPNGIGAARITLNAAEGEICASIGVALIETATMAHIHAGERGVAGPVVVHFTPLLIPGLSVAQGCVPVEPSLIAQIAANPSAYYVNVHNTPFPAGAVRGQLR
ncbi:MAG: CHRD domain-containing protein [Dehalococcoidia bacterium]